MSLFRKMVERDPIKYPNRMGEKWEDDEVIKLLTSIKKKKLISDIAIEHERTIGGINAQRKKLATEYWFNDKRPIEEIMKFTGLTKLEIQDAITRKSHSNSFKKVINIRDESITREPHSVINLTDESVTKKTPSVIMNYTPHMPRNDTTDIALIRELATEIIDTLGVGHTESVYHNAMKVGIQDANLKFETERDIILKFRDRYIGTVRADLIIENRLVVELKCISCTNYSVSNAIEQCRIYMRETAIPSGIVVVFPKRVDDKIVIYSIKL